MAAEPWGYVVIEYAHMGINTFGPYNRDDADAKVAEFRSLAPTATYYLIHPIGSAITEAQP